MTLGPRAFLEALAVDYPRIEDMMEEVFFLCPYFSTLVLPVFINLPLE